ncbi:MAG: glutaredoxin family protein [Casimicrobiaceae bacterium]
MTGEDKPPVLTLLTRAYCHLCDEMREALGVVAPCFGAVVTELDVDADPALEEAFGEWVPVLLLGSVADGVRLCHYRLDHERVAAALAADAAPTSFPAQTARPL